MQALSLSSHPQTPAATGDLAARWRRALVVLIVPASLFAVAWACFEVPGSVNDGTRGWRLVLISTFGPAFIVALLAPLVALVQASGLEGARRSLVLVVATFTVVAMGSFVDVHVMLSTGVWPAPPWSGSVLWWANAGSRLVLCAGAVLVYDSRLRGLRRASALRELRVAARDMARRTSKARLLAMRARVDPGFLLDALAAVERIAARDLDAGDRVLDSLITYLRAALPDLRNHASTLGKELDLARAWLDLQAVLRGNGLRYEIAIAADLPAVSFPPMMVIPLLELMIGSAAPRSTLEVSAKRIGDRIVLRVAAGNHGGMNTDRLDDGRIADLRARLEELHGDEARLVAGVAEGHCQCEMEVPIEDA